MTLRCRPGDLALVLAGPSTGAFVEVKARAEDYEDSPSWLCRVSTPVQAFVLDMRTRKASYTVVPAGTMVAFLDRTLQPIRPPPTPLDIPAPPVEVTA